MCTLKSESCKDEQCCFLGVKRLQGLREWHKYQIKGERLDAVLTTVCNRAESAGGIAFPAKTVVLVRLAVTLNLVVPGILQLTVHYDAWSAILLAGPCI